MASSPLVGLGLADLSVAWLALGAVVLLLTSSALITRSWRSLKLSEVNKRQSQMSTPSIEALPDFDWKTKEPLQLRPYKSKYNITMGLQADKSSNLIVMDKNYADRVAIRRSLIQQQGARVHGCLPSGESAVRELYCFLLGTYLPQRYPTMFRVTADGKIFHNLVTGRTFPTVPATSDMAAALRILGETVEDDIFLLHQTSEGHMSVAFVCCFPAGFDGSEKLGKLLVDIHGPVPSYEKIGPSMEKFFAKLEVGKSVKRMNWSVQTDDKLFHCDRHSTPEDEVTEVDTKFNIDDVHARMELQTLTRLPETRAVLFSFKTHMYPITQIKAEGGGPDFADAIEGLKTGNAPGMWVYKGGKRWAERLGGYLRS